ncbi:MAG: YtxH domain-containing protein [Acidobacteriota bacterium]|nr:YtxH domain-containing protein [Acidobacteriota bacterium]
MANDEDSGRLSWFVAGAAIGAAVALLYAPKKGRETRDLLTRKGNAGRDALASTSTDIFDRGKDLYERGRAIAEDAADLFERGRKLVRGTGTANP